jgi:hypothetical protein
VKWANKKRSCSKSFPFDRKLREIGISRTMGRTFRNGRNMGMGYRQIVCSEQKCNMNTEQIVCSEQKCNMDTEEIVCSEQKCNMDTEQIVCSEQKCNMNTEQIVCSEQKCNTDTEDKDTSRLSVQSRNVIWTPRTKLPADCLFRAEM